MRLNWTQGLFGLMGNSQDTAQVEKSTGAAGGIGFVLVDARFSGRGASRASGRRQWCVQLHGRLVVRGHASERRRHEVRGSVLPTRSFPVRAAVRCWRAC
jgi:hypothetical protein